MQADSSKIKVRRFTDEEAEDYAGIRMNAVDTMPYFAALIYNLEPVCVPGLGTFASDEHWRVYIDPDKLREWGPSKSGAVLLHEVEHCLREHGPRARNHGANSPEGWNIAADCEINDDLIEAGADLPDSVVLPKHYKLPNGENAEFYYDKLPRQQPDEQPCPQCGGTGDADPSADGQPAQGDQPGDDQGEGEQAGDQQGAGDDAGDDAEGDQAGDGNGAGQQGGDCPACGGDGKAKGGCGSAAGNPVPCELPPDDTSFPGKTETDKDLARRKAAQDIDEYARSSQSRGTLPSGLRRWADDYLKPPQVPWQQRLRGAVKQAINVKAGQLNYSYRRPGRRRIPRVVTPSMTQPIPKVASVIDTSGSMSNDEIQTCLAEVEGICQKAGLRGDNHVVLTVDAATHGVQRINSARDVAVLGGGGTDMGKGIEDAAELRPRPDIVIVFTDGYTPWPTDAPRGCKVIICLVGDESAIASAKSSYPPPGWATVIDVPNAA